jgi:hypothetical protein
MDNNSYVNRRLFNHIENEYAEYIRSKLKKIMNNMQHSINKTVNIIRDLRKVPNPLRTELEKYYNIDKKLRKQYNSIVIDMNNIYICCSPNVRNFLISMGSKLKHAMPSFNLSDIYIALVLTAYSMLSEQHYDMIRIGGIANDTKTVYIGITSGDIMYNGENISSEIRRFFIGKKNLTPIIEPDNDNNDIDMITNSIPSMTIHSSPMTPSTPIFIPSPSPRPLTPTFVPSPSILSTPPHHPTTHTTPTPVHRGTKRHRQSEDTTTPNKHTRVRGGRKTRTKRRANGTRRRMR